MVTEPKADYIRAVHGWSENTEEDMRTVGEAGTGGDGQDIGAAEGGAGSWGRKIDSGG